jgi:predicted RNase H-like nuclease (RuvC/YqgF family)
MFRPVYAILVSWCVGLLLGSATLAFAQTPTDEEGGITSFRDKEEKILALIDRQLPKLERIKTEMKDVKSQLASWEDTLKYKTKIPIYRDKALRDVAALRRKTDNAYQELKDLNMQWFSYTRDIMAVYTRYGELTAAKKVDEHLKNFMIRHRSIMFKMEELLVLVNDNFIQADFLLNSKLN